MKQNKEKDQNFLRRLSASRLDKRLYVYLVCLLFSILFWILTAFSREYITDVTYNAVFVNLPNGKALVKDLPDKIKIRVTSNGFSLLGIRYDAKFDTLFIDASSLRKYMGNNDGIDVYYLLLNNQLSSMAEQLGTSLKVNRIMPDTVTFLFDKTEQKIVPVKLNLQYSFARQHQQSGKVKVIPSQVVLNGPRTLLKEIEFLETEVYKLTDIKGNTKVVVPLKALKKGSIEFGLKSVVAEIKAEKYTESEIELPVQVINVPFGYFVKTFPKSIKIKFKVPLSRYEMVTAKLFKLVADMKQTTFGGSNRLKVTLTQQPDYISNVSLESQYVEFIYRKL